MFVSHYRTYKKHLWGRRDGDEAAFPARIFRRDCGGGVDLLHETWKGGAFKQHHPFTSHTLSDYRLLLKNLLLSKARAWALS